jgi:predicted nucleotidyltransferase
MQPIKSSTGFKALLERRRRERDALIDEARAYAQRLRRLSPRARVFLYGSVARGDFNLSSDIDLLVVSDELPVDPLARAEFLFDLALGREEPKGLLEREYEELESKGRLWHLEHALEL